MRRFDCVGSWVASSQGLRWSSMRQVDPSGKRTDSSKRLEWKVPHDAPSNDAVSAGGAGAAPVSAAVLLTGFGGAPAHPTRINRKTGRREGGFESSNILPVFLFNPLIEDCA